MLRQFYPYEYVPSVFAIDYRRLYEQGYRGLLFDIDNTLVPHGADSTPEIDALLCHLQQMGFQTLLLSNNGKVRIESFLKNIDAPYIDNADKPHVSGYHRALALLQLQPEQAVCIGDQVFTDIRGANCCGMASILVEFIGAKTEKKIGKRRQLEKLILRCYRCSRRWQHRLGNILCEEVQHYGLEKGDVVL